MSNTVKEITDGNYEQVLKSVDVLIIDFWAEWCGPCRMMMPVVEELASEYEGRVLVGKVNVDNNPNISSHFGVRSIPTFLLFKKGEQVDKQIGVVSKKVLSEKLDVQLAQQAV